MTPQKDPQNLHTPKISIFLKTPQNIKIQNFEPPQNGPSLRVCMKISEYPPPRANIIDPDQPDLCLYRLRYRVLKHISRCESRQQFKLGYGCLDIPSDSNNIWCVYYGSQL